MKKIINKISVVIIIIGGLFLTVPHETNAEILLAGCSNWSLSCDGGTCCSVCDDDGAIGDCIIMVE